MILAKSTKRAPSRTCVRACAAGWAAFVGGVVLLLSCVGGQGPEAQQAANAPGPNARATAPVAKPERDWTEAATGHGAVGAIPAAELARLERESAPGGNLGSDAGPSPSPTPSPGTH